MKAVALFLAFLVAAGATACTGSTPVGPDTDASAGKVPLHCTASCRRRRGVSPSFLLSTVVMCCCEAKPQR